MNSWWRFALNANAPRFLRATAGAVAVILLVAMARLFKLRAGLPAPVEPVNLDEVQVIVQQAPDTTAWLALLGDKQFLFSPTRKTFIMFAIQGNSWIAMGDPVGLDSEKQDLIWQFREQSHRQGGKAAFYQVDSNCLNLYLELGMTFIKLGEEARVNLTSFSLEGPERRELRHIHHKFAREGILLQILPVDRVESCLEAIMAISDSWLTAKNTREKGFLLGYFDRDYIRRCPVALALKGDRILAFSNLWLSDTRQELSVDLMRYQPDEAPGGTMDFLFTELMLWGKNEGYQWFNLGSSPLSGIEDHALATFWMKVSNLIYRHAEHFYNFQGLHQYKEKFNPEWRPKYLACPNGFALPQIISDLTTLTSGGLKGLFSK